MINKTQFKAYIYGNCNCNNLINIGESGKIATLEEYEREIIKYALKRLGSFNATGKALGITHKTVATKAKKYNIIEGLECDSWIGIIQSSLHLDIRTDYNI